LKTVKNDPLNFRPTSPEIIMVDPQRKCYGLKNFCRSNIPCRVLLSSDRLGESSSQINVANLKEKCIRIYYLCVPCRKMHTIFSAVLRHDMTSFGHSTRSAIYYKIKLISVKRCHLSRIYYKAGSHCRFTILFIGLSIHCVSLYLLHIEMSK
jgi:hypothetical protein